MIYCEANQKSTVGGPEKGVTVLLCLVSYRHLLLRELLFMSGNILYSVIIYCFYYFSTENLFLKHFKVVFQLLIGRLIVCL